MSQLAYGFSDASLHVLMVSFPAQGHVNPLLRLGNCLASKGLLVTFSTTKSFGEEMRKANEITDKPIPVGNGAIRFEFFDDGWDFRSGQAQNIELYMQHLELIGREKLKHILNKHEQQGLPVCFMLNNPFVPWVSDVAESHGIPSALLWVQSCACFAAYYHYQHGLVDFPSEEAPDIDVQLQCMPLLKYDEVPTFLHPYSCDASIGRVILSQHKKLSKLSCVLMDTFEELEHDLIEYMSTLCPIKSIGPLFKNPTVSGMKIGGNIMKADDDCIQWLDSKSPSSVVYISFGTVVHLKQEQVDEIAYGLLNSQVSFLWVMKPTKKDIDYEPHVLPDRFFEEVGDKGRVVNWSPQERVLAHPSVACFLTHCGWNSTMEALANGVPLLAFPQWGDQVTNAKYLVDVFKVGIRMCRGQAENRIIPRDEIVKCLRDATNGPKAAEMRENALNWRKKAEEAVADGGFSLRNMQCFVDELSRMRIAKK